MSLRARILLLVLFAMLTPVVALTFFLTGDREESARGQVLPFACIA